MSLQARAHKRQRISSSKDDEHNGRMSDPSTSVSSGDVSNDDEQEREKEEEEERLKSSLRHISFGALVEAQEEEEVAENQSKRDLSQQTQRSFIPSSGPLRTKSPGQRRGKADARVLEAEEKVARLRARLAELRAQKEDRNDNDHDDANASPMSTHVVDVSISNKKGRSKHAPTEQTSTRPVSRKRQAVDTSHLDSSYLPSSSSSNLVSARPLPGRSGGDGGGVGGLTRTPGKTKRAGDPRFSSLSGRVNETAYNKNYAFLSTYRASEISTLEEALAKLAQRSRRRKTGVASAEEEAEKAQLRRTLDSLKNKQKSLETAERMRRIKSHHRRAEREAVRQGRKEAPWFLKDKDLKQKLVEEENKGLSEKEQATRDRKRLVRKEKKDRRKLGQLGTRRKIN